MKRIPKIRKTIPNRAAIKTYYIVGQLFASLVIDVTYNANTASLAALSMATCS